MKIPLRDSCLLSPKKKYIINQRMPYSLMTYKAGKQSHLIKWKKEIGEYSDKITRYTFEVGRPHIL